MYPAISIAVTVWQQGRCTAMRAAATRGLEDSVNHLLVGGFCLVNFGYVTRALRTSAQRVRWRQAIELVSNRIGQAFAFPDFFSCRQSATC